MSIVERILGIFLSYAELAQGWNPQEEDDYQDFVNAVDNALAPAEQAKRLECRFGEGGIGIVPGDVAGRPAVFLTEVAAPGEVGKPIPKGECGETRVVLTFPTKEQASRVVAALAQNAQGDKPVAWCAGLDATVYGFIDAKAWKEGEFTTPLYLHAERARVPELQGWTLKLMPDRDDVMAIWACDPDGTYVYLAAAAPSQPEDAA